MASRQAPRAEPTRVARRASTRMWRRTGFVRRSLVQVAGVRPAMEHVLHERGDACRVGAPGAVRRDAAARRVRPSSRAGAAAASELAVAAGGAWTLADTVTSSFMTQG